ncbi:hypothetical protein EB796_008945 [Bugula neritina]|uniref:Uncharacterized protein n=1 Tax=Bugula neritina TaxID=10212 RepID=A0A7J7K564_BUGNE|nr:hypothetical protein EB796_008945 [Bugula neritina]
MISVQQHTNTAGHKRDYRFNMKILALLLTAIILTSSIGSVEAAKVLYTAKSVVCETFCKTRGYRFWVRIRGLCACKKRVEDSY